MRATRPFRTALGIVLALACALVVPGAAAARPQASLHVTLRPDRLGARTAVTVAMQLSDPDEEGEVPAPLRRVTIHLPPGLGVKVGGVAVCRPGALRAHGAAGCPRSSQVGGGSATLEVHAGSQTIPEHSRLTAFRAPNVNGRPALAVLGVGSTPLAERSVSLGSLQTDASPYGLRLVLSVPSIPTLALEPDASFISMSLTLGTGSRGALTVPRSCPAGGFPFAAELGFAGGQTAEESSTVPCP